MLSALIATGITKAIGCATSSSRGGAPLAGTSAAGGIGAFGLSAELQLGLETAGMMIGAAAGAAIQQASGNQGSSEQSNSGGGTSTKVTNNLGKEIDITPSTNHTTTTKNPGLKGTPNSSIDIIDSAGNIKTRRWFGSDGVQIRDVDFTNHGNAKLHPEWPHEHGIR